MTEHASTTETSTIDISSMNSGGVMDIETIVLLRRMVTGRFRDHRKACYSACDVHNLNAAVRLLIHQLLEVIN